LPRLPLRLALPHLEPVLALNVGKEVEKDTLVIRRARASCIRRRHGLEAKCWRS
jgi:hypothetical protein